MKNTTTVTNTPRAVESIHTASKYERRGGNLKWVRGGIALLALIAPRTLEPRLADPPGRLERVLVDRRPPSMTVSPVCIANFHLLPDVAEHHHVVDTKRACTGQATRERIVLQHRGWHALTQVTPASLPIIAVPHAPTAPSTRGAVPDDANRLAPQLLLLKAHQLGHEPNVRRDALSPVEHERVGARERPMVRVDEVSHDCCHRARLARFAMDICR